METTVKILKDNGLLAQIVELSFDEYLLIRDSLKFNANRFDFLRNAYDEDDELQSVYDNEYQSYINLLSKFEQRSSSSV